MLTREGTHLRHVVVVLVPGCASVAFVLLCALDSAAGNVIDIPATWLLVDATVGLLALIAHARHLRCWVVLLLSGFSTAATGSALAELSRISHEGKMRSAQRAGVVFVLLTFVRWHLPWVPYAYYHDHWSGVVFTAVTVQCFIAWGGFFGSRARLVESLREQNEALRLNREADVRFALAQERLSLAREMHDVLAHQLSLVSMHASALEHRASMSDAERRELGGVIRSSARASLTELRAILSDLREELPNGTQPDISDLPQLAADSTDSPHPVQISVDEAGAVVPPGTGRHLYRIAQEAVTNARKHGAPGPVHVQLYRDGASCVLEVTNPAGGGEPSDSGLGVRGMIERVHLCGGQLTRSNDRGVHKLLVRVPVEEAR